MAELARMLKALSDPTRIRIVHLLNGREELCVCEIVDALEIPQYSVSRHLGVLKAAGVVTDWRQGKWMHYAIAPALSQEETAVVAAVCARAAREAAAKGDRKRLKQHLRPRTKGGALTCP